MGAAQWAQTELGTKGMDRDGHSSVSRDGHSTGVWTEVGKIGTGKAGHNGWGQSWAQISRCGHRWAQGVVDRNGHSG